MKNKKGFIIITKSLLLDNNFKNLTNSAKVLLLYLISFSNSFRSEIFYKYHAEIKKSLDFSRISMWRYEKELNSLGITFHSINKSYIFNLKIFFKKYKKMRTFVSKMKQ